MPGSPEVATERQLPDFAEQRALLSQASEQPLVLNSEAFERHEHVCTCIDEGTPGDFRLAGAGILDPAGFDHAVEVMRQAGVTKVESHANCGAVALAARKKLGSEARPEDVEAFGQAWTRKVAAALNVPYAHNIDLERPAAEHDASVVYIDLVGGFRPDRLPDTLPKGFVVSGTTTSPDHVAEQARVAVNIALGDHGTWRDEFTPESPLHIVLVGAKSASTSRHELVAKLHQSLLDLGPRVNIDQLSVDISD